MRSHVRFNKKINCLVIKSPNSIEKNVITINLSQSQNVSHFFIDTVEDNNTRLFGLFYDNLVSDSSVRILTFNSIEDAQECKNKIDKELMRRIDKMSIIKGVLSILVIVLLLKVILLPNNSLSLSDNLNKEVNSAASINSLLQQQSQQQLSDYLKSKQQDATETKNQNPSNQQNNNATAKQSADDLEKLLNSSK